MEQVLKLLSIVSVYVPTVVFFIHWSSLVPKYTLFGLYLLMASTTETYGLYTFFTPDENMMVYNSYVVLELNLLGFFYFHFIKHKVLGIITLLSIFAFDCFAAIELIKSPFIYNKFIWAASASLIGLYSFMYFISISLTENLLSKKNQLFYWFNIAVFMYFPNIQMVYLFVPLVKAYIPYGSVFYCFTYLLNISFHFILTYGIAYEVSSSVPRRYVAVR